MSETAVNGVEPIIFLDDVHVTFRTRTGSILHPNLVHAVQGVTIRLMPGQTIGIVGESGCGKSTTANVMCGLQAPTSGKVYFKGKDVTKRTAEDRRHMGRVISVVFQNPATALNPRMVVREQLLDPMRVHNLGTEAEQEKRVKELLELTGLPSSAAEVLPGQLSGGQRQRVAIARALSLNPDAIIADEPTSALDVSVRAQILNLLTDLKKELGLAMVFISHDIQTVRYISDDIIVMNGGKIVEPPSRFSRTRRIPIPSFCLVPRPRCCIPSSASSLAFPPVRPVPLPGAPPLRFRKVGFTSHAKCSGATTAIWWVSGRHAPSIRFRSLLEGPHGRGRRRRA